MVSSQVVEHLWDQDQFVRECARVLRPGGRLVVTTPNRRTFPPGNPFHSRELDAAELTRLVGQHLDVDRVLGVQHGPRLAADDARLGGLVDCPGDHGAGPARRRPREPAVAAVTATDFDLGDRDLDGCLDLVLTAVRR